MTKTKWDMTMPWPPIVILTEGNIFKQKFKTFIFFTFTGQSELQ